MRFPRPCFVSEMTNSRNVGVPSGMKNEIHTCHRKSKVVSEPVRFLRSINSNFYLFLWKKTTCTAIEIEQRPEFVCLFVCYSCGTPESPLPLNPGQGSDSPGINAATRSISVRGQRSHVPYPRWLVHKRHAQGSPNDPSTESMR